MKGELVAKEPTMAGAAEEERKFKEMFRILDTRIIGYISCEALQGVLSPMKNEVGLKEEEIKEMIFEEIDKNKDQRITFNGKDTCDIDNGQSLCDYSEIRIPKNIVMKTIKFVFI